MVSAMRSLVAFVGSLALGACSGDDAKPDPTDAKSAKTAAGPVFDPKTTGDAAWDAPATPPPDGAKTPAPQAGDDPFRGPCTIKWSDGRTLEFKYTEAGGSVNVDLDGDGKRDTCGTYKTENGRPTYLRLDEGCDRETDGTLRLKYQEGSSLASGTMTREDETTRMTIIPLPSFGGVVPGYTLPGRARNLKIEEKDGKIQTVTVKKGAGRPAKRVQFSYDEQGRISGITEDVGTDGSVEMQFTYVYDPAGNVSSIRSLAGKTEATATLTYDCW